MRYRATLPVVAKSQDLPARAELPVGRIVEYVALEGALRHQLEPEGAGCRAKRSNIRHGKLQLDLCSLHGVSIRLESCPEGNHLPLWNTWNRPGIRYDEKSA
jgi:hypothetical protein